MKAPFTLTPALPAGGVAPAAGSSVPSGEAAESLFQSTVESTDPPNSTQQQWAGCGACFYCDQEMPSCCDGVIGGADPRDPLPRRRRRPSPLRRIGDEAQRLLTVRWARRVLAVARE